MYPLDFIRYLPRTNCGVCGHPSCLAFAVAVTKGGADPSRCPHIDPAALEGTRELPPGQGLDTVDEGQRERDMALAAHLRSKIRDLDFAALAVRVGAEPAPEQPDCLHFRYLGRRVELGRDTLRVDGLEPVDPRDLILLYNYLSSGGGPAPRCIWVGLESLPNSISKVRTLAAYCEQPLARRFKGRRRPLADVCGRLGPLPPAPEVASADFGAVIPVLPHVPLCLLFWDEAPEEGFDSRVKVLVDERVLDFLDLESLVFAAERMAERLMELDA
ncbi:MAG TPA: DUF3786 domain-containing protein [Desulfobacteraceae bacterium]|nr:DUF3786 domain-containing protein [Desulfobacteraceae bacterium]